VVAVACAVAGGVVLMATPDGKLSRHPLLPSLVVESSLDGGGASSSSSSSSSSSGGAAASALAAQLGSALVRSGFHLLSSSPGSAASSAPGSRAASLGRGSLDLGDGGHSGGHCGTPSALNGHPTSLASSPGGHRSLSSSPLFHGGAGLHGGGGGDCRSSQGNSPILQGGLFLGSGGSGSSGSGFGGGGAPLAKAAATHVAVELGIPLHWDLARLGPTAAPTAGAPASAAAAAGGGTAHGKDPENVAWPRGCGPARPAAAALAAGASPAALAAAPGSPPQGQGHWLGRIERHTRAPGAAPRWASPQFSFLALPPPPATAAAAGAAAETTAAAGGSGGGIAWNPLRLEARGTPVVVKRTPKPQPRAPKRLAHDQPPGSGGGGDGGGDDGDELQFQLTDDEGDSGGRRGGGDGVATGCGLDLQQTAGWTSPRAEAAAAAAAPGDKVYFSPW